MAKRRPVVRASGRMRQLPASDSLVADTIVFPAQYDAGSSGAAKTIDFANGQKQKLLLTGNCTVSLSFPGVGAFQIILTQDGTGNRSVTWSGVTLYVDSPTAPEINTAAGGATLVSVFYDGANVWLGAGKVNA